MNICTYIHIYIYLHINMDGQRLSNWWILWLTILILLVYVPPPLWSWTSIRSAVANQRSVRIRDTKPRSFTFNLRSNPFNVDWLIESKPVRFRAFRLHFRGHWMCHAAIATWKSWDCWWVSGNTRWVGYVMRCGRTLEFWWNLLHILGGLANPWWW